MGLPNRPLCRRCGVDDETWAHILCECEALASLRHAYLGSFFLYLVDINSLSLGDIWNFSKGKGLPCTGIRLWDTKGLLIMAEVHRDRKGSNPIANQSINQSKASRVVGTNGGLEY
jgi:hypothetical protein